MATVPQIFKNMSYGPIEESSSLVEEWAKHKKLGLYINGELSKTEADDCGEDIKDPYTEKVLFNIHIAASADVDKAVASCTAVSSEWKIKVHHTNYLLKIANLIENHGPMLAQAESLTRNVQLKDPREFDIPALARWFKYYQGWATVSETELSAWEPYGLVAVVNGYNSPLAALAWLVAPALAAGNTVCLVVPAKDALPALILAHICTEAGLPNGVFNVVPGGQEAINHLVRHQDVVKVASYGPTEFVRQIKEKMSDFPSKKLSMIMTGKTQMLVFEDADFDSAVESAVQSAWYNQGSAPWSVKTLLVQESVFKTVVAKLKRRVTNLRMGGAFDKMADLGRPYDKHTIERLAQTVEAARHNGIEVFQVKNDLSDEYLCPTVCIGGDGASNLVKDHSVMTPVITVVPFRTAKEAVSLANNTRYGFAASIWSSDTSVSVEVADKLQVGTVWINCHGVMDPAVPMEGWKASGGNSFGGKPGFLDNLCVKPSGEPSAVNIRKPGAPKDTFEAAKRAYKLYYGGTFKNADGNANQTAYHGGKPYSFADANRKDVRNAVAGALQAQSSWSSSTPTQRSQVLYNVLSSLSATSDQLISHLELMSPSTASAAQIVADTLLRVNYWAGVCDKPTLSQSERNLPNVTATVTREPLGILAIGVYGLENEVRLFDELIWPAICYGNCVVLVVDSAKPSGCLELLKAIAGALPAGVVNVLTGNASIFTTLAEHQNVSAVLHFHFPDQLAQEVEAATLHNMKRIVNINESDFGMNRSPFSVSQREVFELAMTRAKTIWINKGDMFAN